MKVPENRRVMKLKKKMGCLRRIQTEHTLLFIVVKYTLLMAITCLHTVSYGIKCSTKYDFHGCRPKYYEHTCENIPRINILLIICAILIFSPLVESK